MSDDEVVMADLVETSTKTDVDQLSTVSYTHLTLPTKNEV